MMNSSTCSLLTSMLYRPGAVHVHAQPLLPVFGWRPGLLGGSWGACALGSHWTRRDKWQVVDLLGDRRYIPYERT